MGCQVFGGPENQLILCNSRPINWTEKARRMAEQMYYFAWGNNSKRKMMKGRFCKVLARGKKNSIMIEFVDNGQREIVSRNSIRKVK